MTGGMLINSYSFTLVTIFHPPICHPDEGGISSKFPMRSFTNFLESKKVNVIYK
jgi:hypothetical protein